MTNKKNLQNLTFLDLAKQIKALALWELPEIVRWLREEAEETPEAVNHPAHYAGTIECKDAMIQCFGQEAYNAFCLLNAFKYLWRCNMKDGQTDLQKSEWYLKELI